MTEPCETCGTNKLVTGYCPKCKTRADGTVNENHGQRGPDKHPRAPKAKKTFEKKYYDATGRTVNADMKRMQERIAEMQKIADSLDNEPLKKFEMLEKVQVIEDKFYKTFGPYMLQKQGTIKTTIKDEDMVSLDDVLNGDDNGSDERD